MNERLFQRPATAMAEAEGGGETTTRTTCPYCGVGCGVVVKAGTDGKLKVEGDREHPANFGRLCSKGAALAETMSLDDRLLIPLVNGSRASWDEALDLVARRFSEAITAHGPEAVAIYGSGQLLTEDYYVANKLMKGFVGTANIDTNSRLCMASSVAGHKRAFGSDTVPGTYEDLELADLVVIVGSNLAWCHPVLFQRLAAARERRGTRIVVVDPRRTATCEVADMHLAIVPDSDVALFNGLFVHLLGAGAIDPAFVAAHTSGFKTAFASARQLSGRAICRLTGIRQPRLFEFYDLFAAKQRVVTIYSQGVNQSSCGTDKVNAIINCHLVTGRIGKPGMGPFSVTGQPNAMGGREVGGLSNMLAAHMELDNAEHRRIVQELWRSPRIADKPGLKAVELFRAVGDGRIKALWILSTNPAASMPEAEAVSEALAKCPFVVVSDAIRHTDTTAHAHVLLPALAWGEKSGTVTNSERRISRQRAFLPAPGEARPDWWHLAEVGRRMGWREAFSYAGPDEIFAEHARLSAAGNDGTRDFDIGGLSRIAGEDYDTLDPFQWPRTAVNAGNGRSDGRFFAGGGFYTPDRRARFVAVTPPREIRSTQGNFVLNTGRVRDQWHTMTRTGKAARLMSHIAEPYVEVHPDDARLRHLKPASLARVTSRHGSAVLRVVVTDRQRPGSLFAPMHWTAQLAPAGRIGPVVDAARDPVSGQPALKQTSVDIEPFRALSYALAVMRTKPQTGIAAYAAISPVEGGWRIEAADDIASPGELADRLVAAASASLHDTLAYADAARGIVRRACFHGALLASAVFCGPEPVEVSRAWASSLLSQPAFDGTARLNVLAGRGGAGQRDRGAIVCACLGIGANDILAAAVSGAASIEAVGAATGAGTNCGSCRAEIGRLVDADRLEKAG